MERARQSDTWALASPDLRPWLLMMWAIAWEQTPCGSLPDDDMLIAARIGMSTKTFTKHREILRRKWWLADDGRLYHEVMILRVNEMMQTRRKESDRKALARHRTPTGQEQHPTGVPRESRGTTSGLHPESDTGTGTGEVSDVANATSSSAKPTKGRGRPSIPCPYDDIVDAYHQALPQLPAVMLRDGKTWTKRQKAMRDLWGWVLSSRKADGTKRADTGDEAIAWVRGYFGRAAENDFIAGRTQPGAGHESWRADFDYLLTERGMRKVIEHTRDAA